MPKTKTTISPMSGSSIKHKRLRRVLRILLIALGVWLIFDCALALVVYVYGLTDRAQPADVIIVLGSGLNADLTPVRGKSAAPNAVLNYGKPTTLR